MSYRTLSLEIVPVIYNIFQNQYSCSFSFEIVRYGFLSMLMDNCIIRSFKLSMYKGFNFYRPTPSHYREHIPVLNIIFLNA